MSGTTGIEWTDATWNPVTGCTEVSPGCDHCYAKTFAERWRGAPGHYFENGFDVQLRPDKLDLPLRWRKPRRIFVNSMSDLFHDQVPDGYIAKVFAVMVLAPRHTFQVLTKRHRRMRSLLRTSQFWQAVCAEVIRLGDRPAQALYDGYPPSNVWLGVSAENQQWANIRIPALLDTPAAVRFVSAEPLLGPIDLLGDIETPGPAIVRTFVHTPGGPWGPDEYDYDDQIGIDWVIVGGESGRDDRPMQAAWARQIRDACKRGGIAFLFKQWGETVPLGQMTDTARQRWDDHHGCDMYPNESLWRVGKHRAGRELDGRTTAGEPMTASEVPTYLLGRCDTCQSIQTFTTERARDLWLAHHPHLENYDDE